MYLKFLLIIPSIAYALWAVFEHEGTGLPVMIQGRLKRFLILFGQFDTLATVNEYSILH